MFNNLFLKAGSVDVDAAVLGIGRERWVSAKLEENEVDVLNRMKDNRFDILPIENNKDAPIYSYYYLLRSIMQLNKNIYVLQKN